MMSEETATCAGLVGKARRMWSILLPLWPGGRPAEPCTTALQAGRNTTTLFMARPRRGVALRNRPAPLRSALHTYTWWPPV